MKASSMSRAARALVSSSALAAVVLASGPASAGDAAAQALFDEGRRLTESGQWAQACPKFEESNRIEPKMGTQYKLAECYERVGKLASAWENYLEVAGKAKADKNTEREQFARDKAKALEPRLTRLKISVSPPLLRGLVVKRGAKEIGAAQYGLLIPVDPGRITISASAPGYQTWSEVVEARAEGQNYVATIPQLEPGGPIYNPGGPGPGPGPVMGPGGVMQPQVRYERRSPPLVAVGGVLAALGGITLVGGLLVLAASADGTTGLGEDGLPIGGGMILGGAVGFGVGITLAVIGNQRVPVAGPPPPDPNAPPPMAGPIPKIGVGPGSLQATWHF